MRILFVTDFLLNGGAERQLVLTATNLPPEWEVRVFSTSEGVYHQVLLDAGIPVEVSARRWRRDPLPFLRLWRTVADWRPHLVHSWGYMTTLAGFPAFRALGIPYVDSSIRTGDVVRSHTLRHRQGFDRATLVTANTQSGLESAGEAPPRGRVIHNGFDASRIPAAPSRPGERLGFSVVMAARMSPYKDFESLIAAVRILLAEDSAAGQTAGAGEAGIRCLLLGDGPGKHRILAEHRDLVEAGILEIQATEEVIPELLACDCGVLMTDPSRAVEGCANAILEYMACGLPVVASRGGGNDELVRDGKTGFLVDPCDARGLADRLRWVRRHREEAGAMGAAGAAVVGSEYSVAQMIAATEQVYRDALAAGRTGPQ